MKTKERSPGRKAVRQILICGAILLLVSVVARLVMQNAYYVDIELNPQAAYRGHDLWVEAEDPSILTGGEPRIRDGYLRVPVKPEGRGDSFLFVKDREGSVVGQHLIEVRENRLIRDLTSGGFSGDYVVLICYTVFCFLVCAIMLWHYRRSGGIHFQ